MPEPVEEDLEGTIESVLKINDKFKYALRNIAEKQKKTTLMDQIKKKSSKEQTLNENRLQQVQKEQDKVEENRR